MELIYRTLGMISLASERGSRNRVNGVGMNWWILVAMAIFTGFAIAQVVEAINNRGSATPLSLTTVLAGEGMADRYIAVKGQFDPNGSLTREDDQGNEKSPGELWAPLVDEQAGKALYVKLNLKQLEQEKEQKDGYVRGMLRKMGSDLKSHVSKTAPESAGIRIDNRFVLNAGEKPAGLWIWVAVATPMSILTLMVVTVIVKRYLVFRPMPAPPPPRFPVSPPEPDADPPAMRASGVFVFNQKDRRRFLDIPAALAEMESNDPAIVSNINASDNFMGHVTRDLAGLWAIVMKAGTIGTPEFGRLYAGWSSRPAIRVAYVDAVNSKPLKVVLTFDTDTDRDRAAHEVRKLANP